jgi:hypothetical protein
VLQQNCWKPGVVFRNLASTQVKVSHSFNTECIVPNQEQSMEPQPPKAAKETRAKLQESRSAIVLSHAQRRRERERESAQSSTPCSIFQSPPPLESTATAIFQTVSSKKAGEKPPKKQKRASSRVSSLLSLDRWLRPQETRATLKVGLGVIPKP